MTFGCQIFGFREFGDIPHAAVLRLIFMRDLQQALPGIAESQYELKSLIPLL